MPIIDHQQFTALLPDGSTAKLLGGSITLDEGWAPYVQGDIEVAMPASLSAFDPRATPVPRVVVTMKQEFTDSDSVAVFSALYTASTVATLTAAFGAATVAAITAAHNRPWSTTATQRGATRTFDLNLRRRRRTPSNTLQLSLASDEALLQDMASLIGVGDDGVDPINGGVAIADTLEDLVRDVLEGVFGTVTLLPTTLTANYSEFIELYGPGTPAQGGIAWQAGVTAWDFLAPFVEMAGARLWCDETRVWHIDPVPLNTSLTLAVAAGDDLTDFSDDIDRSGEWADAVSLTYRWTNTAGASFFGTEFARPAGATSHSKVYAVERDLGKRKNGFIPPTGAAAAILAQVNVLGRDVPVSAVNDFTATPGSAVSITLPSTATLNGRIAAVTWGIDSRQMNLTTRNVA